jgi:hypothetical protein
MAKYSWRVELFQTFKAPKPRSTIIAGGGLPGTAISEAELFVRPR